MPGGISAPQGGGGILDTERQHTLGSGWPRESVSKSSHDASSVPLSPHSGPLRSSSPPSSPLPRIDSSTFLVRGVDMGLGQRMDMWRWNVVPWRRVCAEAGLREADRKTAMRTYVDGRPKRLPREVQRMQDKGFATPDSAPNALTLEEWRIIEPSRLHGSQAHHVGRTFRASVPLPAYLHEGDPLECSSILEEQRTGALTEPDSMYTGLLDPALFNQRGELLQGDMLRDALERLDREEQRVQKDGPPLGRPPRQPSHQLEAEDAEVLGDPLGGELASRDGWGWKVRRKRGSHPPPLQEEG